MLYDHPNTHFEYSVIRVYHGRSVHFVFIILKVIVLQQYQTYGECKITQTVYWKLLCSKR